jgi:hypothetical protein
LLSNSGGGENCNDGSDDQNLVHVVVRGGKGAGRWGFTKPPGGGPPGDRLSSRNRIF